MRRSALTFAAIVCVMIAVAASTGRLVPNVVADTPSYVHYPSDSFDAALRSGRTPGYPAMLWFSGAIGGNAAIPCMQLVLHAIAAWALWRELCRWSVAFWPSFAAAMAIGLGCTFMDNVSTIATDAPAASIGVLAAVAMMRWHRKGQRWTDATFVAALSVLAISLRPAYLALVPWTLLCGAMLRFASASRKTSVKKWSWLATPTLITVVVVAWMTLRLVVVDDFGVLPFGHQNLAGVTVQLVSDDELMAVDEPSRKLASEIIAQRDRRIAEGFRFIEGDPTATMTMEGRWNDVIYQVVVPASRTIHGDDMIANHNAIKALNKEIIGRYPLRYARWLLLTARRAAWAIAADIVMHPIFLLAIAITLAWQAFLYWHGVLIGRSTQTEHGTATLFLVGGSYAVVQVGFIILTSPPLGRFADAAAIFVPAWIAAKVVQRYVGK